MLASPICLICNDKASADTVTDCRRCKRKMCQKCSSSAQIYQKLGGKVQLATMTICEACKSEQIQLRHFRETNKLRFGVSSSIGHRLFKFISQSSVDSLATEYREAQTMRKSRENEEIYSRLKNKINQQKLYTRNNLCQPFMELYSMISTDVREEQQHQKVKNLLIALALNKPLNCLENMSQMVLFFLMFFNQQQTYHLVAKLYKNYIPSFIYLNREQQIEELKEQISERVSEEKLEAPFGLPDIYIECWKTLYINKLNPELSFMILEELFIHKNEFGEYFENLMVKIVRHFDKSPYDDAKLKLLRVQPFGIKSTSTKPPPVISLQTKVKDSSMALSQNSLLRKIVEKLVLEQDDVLNDIHNQYLLIIQLLRNEEQELNARQQKFEKEKDDLLQKIVSLHNVLEQSNYNLSRMKEQKDRSDKIYQTEIQALEDKIQELLTSSENTSTASESQSKNSFNQQIVSRSQRKKLLSSIASGLVFQFQSLQMVTLEDTLVAEKQLISTINQNIQQMQNQINELTAQKVQLKHKASLNGKALKLQDETTKLLKILSKKEERFVLQIHQKDTIIQCYQNVLWHLENHLELDQANNISKRVRTIMSSYQPAVPKAPHHKSKGKQKRQQCLLF